MKRFFRVTAALNDVHGWGCTAADKLVSLLMYTDLYSNGKNSLIVQNAKQIDVVFE